MWWRGGWKKELDRFLLVLACAVLLIDGRGEPSFLFMSDIAC